MPDLQGNFSFYGWLKPLERYVSVVCGTLIQWAAKCKKSKIHSKESKSKEIYI